MRYHQKNLVSELGFIKVRDIPYFIIGISIVLENRLACSSYAHYTGSFSIAMHNRDEAYCMEWKNGKLKAVTPVKQEHGEIDIERDRFVKLLFGRISPKEMENEFSMYYFNNDDYHNLIEILFPKMQSQVVSVN